MSKTKALVARVLNDVVRNPYPDEWQLFGIGLLRLALDDELCIHVWHPDYVNKYSSTIHDHDWDFFSTVCGGKVSQQRYDIVETGTSMEMLRKPLPDGVPVPCRLHGHDYDHFGAGQSYYHPHNVPHRSWALPGSVSLLKRVKKRPEGTTASMFYQAGAVYQPVGSRCPTAEELRAICKESLDEWFS